MTTVIKKATAADILAALPALIDRDPVGSVVLIAFKGRQSYAGLRLDIPSSGEKRFAATALGLFCKIQGAEDVVPVVWTDGAASSQAHLLGVLVRRFQQAGYQVRDALVVGSDGWTSHYDPDARLKPLAEIEAAAARLGLEPPAELLGRVPSADDLACRRMRGDLARIRAVVDEGDEPSELEPLHDLPFFAEGALEWGESEIAERGPLLLFALQGPPVRDLVMLQWAIGLELGDAMWAPDTCAGIEAAQRYPDSHSLAADLLLGRSGPPDTVRIETAIELLTALVSRADDADRPAPLCMLAWLNWARGRGSAAGGHIDEALSIAPEYSMAKLLDSLFSSGTLPEWIFTPPNSPQPAA
ncbi:MAG: hypothetical protein JWR04_1195 [Rhodoglobus sp.]|nr:hypothetical protein [Rhodoglobus sp.]